MCWHARTHLHALDNREALFGKSAAHMKSGDGSKIARSQGGGDREHELLPARPEGSKLHHHLIVMADERGFDLPTGSLIIWAQNMTAVNGEKETGMYAAQGGCRQEFLGSTHGPPHENIAVLHL
jgi:hypothetical protein